jgi:iron complex outermembrane receptor protein
LFGALPPVGGHGHRDPGRRRLGRSRTDCRRIARQRGPADQRRGITLSLQPIIVSPRRRSEVLQKVPVTVDVVKRKEIVQEGIKSIADLVRLSPGVTYDQGISTLDSRPAIRGFVDERGQPSVAILVDGFDTTTQSVVSAGGGAPVNLNLLPLAQVEIVKGPQAALYGRNAFGGAINYITQKPTSVPTGEIDTEIGNHGDYKAYGTFSNAINDYISYRAGLETDGENGFYKNTTTGKLLGGHATQGGLLDIMITPNSNVSIRIYNEWGHSIYQQDAAVNIAANAVLPNFSLASLPSPVVPQVVGTLHANASEVAYAANYPGTSLTTEYHYVTLQDNLGDETFSSHTSYSNVGERVQQNLDYGTAVVPTAFFAFENELQAFTQHTTQVSQEFRMTSNSSSNLQWLYGVYLFYEHAGVLDDTQYYLDHPSFFYPFARTSPTDSSNINPETKTIRNTYHASAYGSLDYAILPNLKASAAARIAYEAVDSELPNVSRTAVTLYQPPVIYGQGGVPLGLGTVTGSTVTRYINPQFALDWGVTPDQNIYASISHGTKPAGLSLLNISGGGFAGQAYKQEKVWSYEAGDKLRLFNDRVAIDADGYFNDYSDLQVPYSDLNFDPPTVGVTNAEAVYGLGQEIEITALPIPELSLNAGYSHINEFFKNYHSLVASDLEYVDGNFDGKKVPDVPPNEITATARYEAPVTPQFNGFIQASAQYESARYANDYNNFKLGAFWEPRFLVGVENAKYTFLFYMTNPFNSKTIQSAIGYFNLHDDFSPTALAYLPDPMQFGFRLNAKF